MIIWDTSWTARKRYKIQELMLSKIPDDFYLMNYEFRKIINVCF